MIPGGWSFSRVIARFRLSSWRFAGTRNVCAPREKKQGSPAKAPGVDGVNGGVLQSSDAMTEAMSSTGLWRGGGVGGRKRINCGSAGRAVFGPSGALVSPEFALGARFERFYRNEQQWQAVTRLVWLRCRFLLCLLVCYRPLARSCFASVQKRVYGWCFPTRNHQTTRHFVPHSCAKKVAPDFALHRSLRAPGPCKSAASSDQRRSSANAPF